MCSISTDFRLTFCIMCCGLIPSSVNEIREGNCIRCRVTRGLSWSPYLRVAAVRRQTHFLCMLSVDRDRLVRTSCSSEPAMHRERIRHNGRVGRLRRHSDRVAMLCEPELRCQSFGNSWGEQMRIIRWPKSPIRLDFDLTALVRTGRASQSWNLDSDSGLDRPRSSVHRRTVPSSATSFLNKARWRNAHNYTDNRRPRIKTTQKFCFQPLVKLLEKLVSGWRFEVNSMIRGFVFTYWVALLHDLSVFGSLSHRKYRINKISFRAAPRRTLDSTWRSTT